MGVGEGGRGGGRYLAAGEADCDDAEFIGVGEEFLGDCGGGSHGGGVGRGSCVESRGVGLRREMFKITPSTVPYKKDCGCETVKVSFEAKPM